MKVFDDEKYNYCLYCMENYDRRTTFWNVFLFHFCISWKGEEESELESSFREDEYSNLSSSGDDEDDEEGDLAIKLKQTMHRDEHPKGTDIEDPCKIHEI